MRDAGRTGPAATSDGIYETAELIDDPDSTLAVQTDVADQNSVAESIEATVDRFGELTCLVNNAGIAGPMAPIEETEEDEWHHVFDVNVVGLYRTATATLSHLRSRAEEASIVKYSSIGKRPGTNPSGLEMAVHRVNAFHWNWATTTSPSTRSVLARWRAIAWRA
ncbi:MAG: SDR family oxidoreductase [Natrialbaceae archaeon]|nr:SDR family oxidoreductase [Natrialbaceae archaeon]